MSARAWLQRLSFSMFVIAFALLWDGQQRWRSGEGGWRTPVMFAGAFACIVIGAIGVRLRHQPQPSRPNEISRGESDDSAT